MRLTIATALLLAIGATTALAQQPTATPAASPPKLQWGPAPAVFPPGARMAVLQGNPAGTALFTVRLRLPDGYEFPPHTHPTDEHVTVISGTFRVGMGTSVESNKMMTLRPGGFVTAPANHAHYAVAKGVTVVQVSAMGPFALTYVNPADAPRTATSKR
ncbi:MAG TPA: cupin domain-containing protein [Gemmatimonadaceae bacterium]